MRTVLGKSVAYCLAYLFLFSLTVPAMAWPPPCPDCYEWNGSDCVWACGSGSCCGGSCCNEPCCGEICCGVSQYCCGDTIWNELCCNENEVCCWGFDGMGGIYYYCNPPCWDEVTDTTTCAESHEQTYECPGCTVGLVSPTCLEFTWRDYSGLTINECHDGCVSSDWNVETEICYETKKCGGILREDFVCFDCGPQGLLCQHCGISCILGGVVGCLIQGVCSLVTDCFDCCTLSEVVDTFTKETCNCL